jgi:tryptophan halogenase
MHKLIIVGGGTAGIMAAALASTHFGKSVEVTLVYDHKNPSIGVGESLTPKIHNFLREIGVTPGDLIKNTNATIKLGIKFKNWLNDGKHHWHSFTHVAVAEKVQDNFENLTAGYDIINGTYDLDHMYSPWYMENNMLPDLSTQMFSMHFDVLAFNKYIESLSNGRINIVDDIVTDVLVKGENIEGLVLAKGGKVAADFYIDASGMASVLMKRLPNKWIDRSNELPMDRFIPNPIPTDPTDKNLPCYTTAEATTHGWSLAVPLQHRWGTGYVYSSQFTTDDEAFEDFAKLIRKNFKTELNNTDKILKFKSGFWEKQWVGNCIVTGLASSFAEPLEATNIHHTIVQLFRFFRMFNFIPLERDRKVYNENQKNVIENIYMYLRFCYTTGRTDSKFWEYMTNNTPERVRLLEEKIKTSFINGNDFEDELVFGFANFTPISYGLKKFNKNNIKAVLEKRNRYETAQKLSIELAAAKEAVRKLPNTRHKKLIDTVLAS